MTDKEYIAELEKEKQKLLERVEGATAIYIDLQYARKRIAELEAQIEKMKSCCQKCSHLCRLCELGIDGCYVCSRWELRR